MAIEQTTNGNYASKGYANGTNGNSNGNGYKNGNLNSDSNGAAGLEGEQSKPVGSYPSTGVDVLIVGTGLAGLTSAIECVRKGHNVRVLERNADINTSGKQNPEAHKTRCKTC